MSVDRRTLLCGLATFAAAGCTGIRVPPPRLTPLSPTEFSPVVSGLQGVEGIAVTADGRLFLSNSRSALAVVERHGAIRHVGNPISPLGIAVDPQGRAIVANNGLLNNGPGPLQRVDPSSGTVEILVTELEGRTLVASNAPAVASDGTIYCTHSTWGPIGNIGTTEPTGFVYSVAPDGRARIVARHLRGPNGCCLDAGERYLYVALTAEGRICRFRRNRGASLGPRENVGPVLGRVVANHRAAEIRAQSADQRAALGYCDGLAFDRFGNLWITLPFGNRIVALTRARELLVMVDDPQGARINMPTNLAWGKADPDELYVACRGSGTIVRARWPTQA